MGLGTPRPLETRADIRHALPVLPSIGAGVLVDGAFWVGPPFSSRTWRHVTSQRNAGTPLGHGHVYVFEHYLDGWFGLTDASGWTPEALADLKARFAAQQR